MPRHRAAGSGAARLLVAPNFLEKVRHTIGEVEQLTDPWGRTGLGAPTGVLDLIEQFVDPAGEPTQIRCHSSGKENQPLAIMVLQESIGRDGGCEAGTGQGSR